MNVILFLRHKYNWSYVIITLLLIVRDVLMVGLPEIAIPGTIGLCMMLLPYNKAIPFLCFTFPLTCGIPGYSMLIAFLTLLFKSPRICPAQIIPIVILVLLELFSDISYCSDTATILSVISFLSFSSIFFYFLNIKEIKFRIHDCIVAYIFGTLLCLSIIAYVMLTQWSIDVILSGAVRSGALGAIGNAMSESSGHLAANANTLAYYAISSLACIVCFWKNIQISKIKLTILALLTLFLGFFSVSRTYLICVALLLCSYMLVADKTNRLKYIILLLVVTIGVCVIFPNIIESIVGGFEDRREADDFITAGGRTEIFQIYQNKWLSDPTALIFGAGAICHADMFGLKDYMHNALQQIWVCLGLIGFFMYLWYFTLFLTRCYSKDRIVLFLPLIITFLFDQSIQFLNPYFLMLPWIPCILLCRFFPNNSSLIL